jgi:hypothetical protein
MAGEAQWRIGSIYRKFSIQAGTGRAVAATLICKAECTSARHSAATLCDFNRERYRCWNSDPKADGFGAQSYVGDNASGRSRKLAPTGKNKSNVLPAPIALSIFMKPPACFMNAST